MKNSKAILLAIFTSLFAVLTVVNMSLASPKSAGENTLDMLEIMTRAFDESEGGETVVEVIIEGSVSCTFVQGGIELMRCMQQPNEQCIVEFDVNGEPFFRVTCLDSFPEEEVN